MHQAGAMLSYSKACFGVPKHGIYEGSVVKPVGADFVEQKFFRNILVTVGVGRSALCPTWSMV
ncbi:MAG TPA: hypothetical protein VK395_15640 [Gemmataceae bacterium]|nr:hypothetical protein [Gemmataceae bacterium]